MSDQETEIYSRWINNQLSSEELETLRKSGELDILQKIVSETDSWEVPPHRTTYSQLKEKLNGKQNKGAKVISLFKPWRMAAVLVCISSLAVALYLMFFRSINLSTQVGETITVKLPDNTTVILDGGSDISYKAFNWENNRRVRIKGKVHFDVERKGDFVVDFEGGSVAVKGTAFEVLATGDFKQVKCYHGKVSVSFGSGEYMLLPGNGVDSDLREFTFETSQVSDNAKYTRFENAKLQEVLASLSSKFGYKFELKSNHSKKLFTGQYDNTNGDKALKMVLNSLSVDYEVKDKKVILK